MKYEVTEKDGVFTVVDKETALARFQIADGKVVMSTCFTGGSLGDVNDLEEAREFFMACGSACELAMDAQAKDESNADAERWGQQDKPWS